MTLAQELEAFVLAHPLRTFERGGITWHYRRAGVGPHGLLLLPGAVGDGEAYFSLVPALSATHTMIAIAYPPVARLDGLLDGLRALAVHEHASAVDLVGGSFGGLVAQAFLQRHPAVTRRVVLSATGPATRERAASNEKWARIVARLPLPITRTLLRTIVRITLKNVPDERRFWRDFYFDAIARLSKPDLMARYALSAALDREGPVSPADVAGWTGAMLLLEGDADTIAHGRARETLKAMYPAARLHTFPGGGHAISAEKPREWARIVSAFLTRA